MSTKRKWMGNLSQCRYLNDETSYMDMSLERLVLLLQLNLRVQKVRTNALAQITKNDICD